ncbi:MAG: Creatinine amidohydrolase [Pseudomonadota bacterium]
MNAAARLPWLPTRQWADLKTTDFARLPAHSVAVLPVATTEQHGPHLPLSVDADLADAIVAACQPHLPDELPALFLPTLRYGLSPEHAAFAGTLTLRPETCLQLWADIAASVQASGVQRLVIFNTHGGHVGLMDVAGRDLRARLGMMVWGVSWFNLPLHDAQGQDLMAAFGAAEARFGVHAGAVETAMMLACRPAQVDMTQARDFASASQARAAQFEILGNGRSAKLAWQMQDYNPQGAAGNAAAADAARGQALIAAAGRALAQLLQEIDRLPPETLRPAP